MAISNERLDYDEHFAHYKNLGVLAGDQTKDAYWHQQAEHMHALCVSDAIRDVHLDAVFLGHRVSNAEAKLQLHFGVGRRTKVIWLSFRHLLGLIHPERTEPLPHDEVEQAAQDLNAIYINIRGVLDNFAWSVLALFGEERMRDLAKRAPSTVNLFGNDYLKDPNLGDVAKLMSGFEQWNKELKARRDPAAHRIPLSVPPSLLDQETHKTFVEIQKEWVEASNAAIKAAGAGADSAALFQKAEALSSKLERIGTFKPLFVHHPEEGVMKIYPVVPQDIGQLVKISRGLSRIISDRIKA